MVTFTVAQRQQIVAFAMKEANIESFAELARRAGVDKGALHRFMHGEGALGAEGRARVADALRVEREQFELLFDPSFALDVVCVEIGIWRELVGVQEVVEAREVGRLKNRDRRERERERRPKLPGPTPRW